MIKSTSLHDIFVPNRKEHLKKYKPSGIKSKNPFTCDISDQTVVKLMQLNDIDDHWKVLFVNGNREYLKIMIVLLIQRL